MTISQPQNSPPIGILIVDNQPIFRQGIGALLARTPDLAALGEAGDGHEAVRLARSLRPDVVSIGVSIAGLNGVDATRRIREDTPETKVLAVSQQRDRRLVGEMLSAGASGYVVKTCTFEEYADAIRAVAGGRRYLSPAVADLLVGEYLEPSAKERGLLSGREREVLQLIAEGLLTSEVARQLHISTKTVDTHRRKIMEKLGVRSIAELTKYAVREGLTTLD